jgi:hypothetical protein
MRLAAEIQPLNGDAHPQLRQHRRVVRCWSRHAVGLARALCCALPGLLLLVFSGDSVHTDLARYV